jgi:hypothetical protein
MVQEGVQPLANELRHLITEIQAARQAGSRLETRLTQGLTFAIHGSLIFTLVTSQGSPYSTGPG